MKSLQTLIKLRRKEIDSILKQISIADKKKDEIGFSLVQLLQTADSERQSYRSSTQYASMLEKYLEHARKQEISYKHQISNLLHQIKAMREKLHDEFTELKKLEIILERKEEAQKKMILKAENNERDELTILRYKKQ